MSNDYTPNAVSVILTKEDVGEALALYAARKIGVKGSFGHKVQIHGSWIAMGSGPSVSVLIEPLPNVLPMVPGEQ